MSNEVYKLLKMKDLVTNQWKELSELCLKNPPPYINLHIPFNILMKAHKLEKCLRISNKLILKIIERLHVTEDISEDEKEYMYKNLEIMRNEIVQQQWDVYDIEQTLKGKNIK